MLLQRTCSSFGSTRHTSIGPSTPTCARFSIASLATADAHTTDLPPSWLHKRDRPSVHFTRVVTSLHLSLHGFPIFALAMAEDQSHVAIPRGIRPPCQRSLEGRDRIPLVPLRTGPWSVSLRSPRVAKGPFGDIARRGLREIGTTVLDAYGTGEMYALSSRRPSADLACRGPPRKKHPDPVSVLKSVPLVLCGIRQVVRMSFRQLDGIDICVRRQTERLHCCERAHIARAATRCVETRS